MSTLESRRNDYNALKVWGKHFSLTIIGNMITSHNLAKVKAEVEQELQWFQKKPHLPTTACITPSNKAIKEFKEMLLSNPNGKVLHSKYTLAEDLATFCCSRWISLQAIDPIIPMINEMNRKQKVILHGMISGMSVNAMADKLLSMGDWPIDLEAVLLILNVAKDPRQNTFVSSETVRGSHWSLLKLEIRLKSYIYLDTLGYSAPNNMQEKVNPLIQAISRLVGVELPSPDHAIIGRAHKASCNNARTTCKSDCLKTNPLQQCSSICGPITALMSALCIGAPEVTSLTIFLNFCE